MHFTLAPAVLALATVVSATTFQVNVGQNGLAYTPPTVNASVGDTVEFIFHPKNHTVTQSTFAAPCTPMSNGIDSNFQFVPTNATQGQSMTVMVNSTDPVWFFCRQTGYVSHMSPFLFFFLLIVRVSACSHCQSGMVFAINPSVNKTFAAFQAAANSSGSSTSSASSPAGSATGASAAPSSSSSSSSSGKNGAVAVGAQAGSLLAAVGFVAGLLL
jgi:plastocyanin